MKRLQFSYTMRMEYSEPVSACHFTLKCFPAEDARQKVLSCRTELIPEASYAHGYDSFGNALIFGSVSRPHTLFSVRVSGEIALLQTGYEAEEPEEPFLYRRPGGMSSAGSGIRAFFAENRASLPADDYEKAIVLMHRLRRALTYEKGCTGPDTPAETAFAMGRGVCQDFTHIFIAVCRLAGIPARYAAGLLVGEGESHAWAEILYRGRWIGLDVTNDIPVTQYHIKFGHGRDAGDCRINTGIVFGGAQQRQSVSAVTELFERNEQEQKE